VDREQSLAFVINEMYAQALRSEQSMRNVLLNPADKTAANNYRKAMEDFDASYKKAASLAARIPEISADLPQLSRLWEECNSIKQKVQALAWDGKT
jgi:hypothetical protein